MQKKMKQRLLLKNNCWASTPAVTPKNWKTGGKILLNKPWRIQYYFHDPLFAAQYPNGKQVRIKGMNSYNTLKERRAATEFLLQEITKILVKENYNPIAKKYMNDVRNTDVFTLVSGLTYALKHKAASKSYKTDLKSAIDFAAASAEVLGLSFIPIQEITRKDIRSILRHQQVTRNISNHRYNKLKAHFGSLFDVLIEDEIIENNPTYKIKKLPETKKIRETLSDTQRNKVHDYLKENHYTFWRFMMIYYKSGARISELLKVKVKDVDLLNREFKVTLQKGGLRKEVKKPINKTVFKIWYEVLTEKLKAPDTAENYIFSKNLQRGEAAIRREQITRRWKKHVKDKLQITADFAALTHLYVDQLSEQLDVNHAAKLRNHTSTRMVEKHYAVGENTRKINRLKAVDIGFLVNKDEDLEVG